MKKIKKKKAFIGAALAGIGIAADIIGKAVGARKEENLKRKEYEREQGQVYKDEALSHVGVMNQELNNRGYIDAMKSRITFKMGGNYSNRFKKNKLKTNKKKFEKGGEQRIETNTNQNNSFLNSNGAKTAGDIIGGLTSLGSGVANLAMSSKTPTIYNINRTTPIQAQTPKVIKAPNDMVQQTNLAMQQVTNPQLYTNQVQNPILNQAKLGTKRIKQKNLNRFK